MWFIVGFVTGVIAGMLVMAVACAAGRADELDENSHR